MRLAPALAVVVALAGCAGARDSSSIVRTAPVQVTRGPDAKLDVNPGPLTVSDVTAVPQGSPRTTVMRLFFWAQWGGSPSVTSLYDRDTVAAVGRRSLRRTYELVRPHLLVSRPEVAFTCRSGEFAFVATYLVSKDPPQPQSFLLHEQGGQWRVVFDTILGVRSAVNPEGVTGETAANIVTRSSGLGGAIERRVGNRATETCRAVNRVVKPTGP